ncbi:MAG: hypothetical protein JW878_08990 [Methanomicrobia archaeon]|nr:hypothetical protein [Methanomicrobia archaeon]
MNEEQDKNETGGLSFAVALLAALGTILYASYTYLQTPSDSFWYFFICGLFSIAVVLVFCLLLYILIKGYSIEVANHERTRWLNKRASTIYLMVFPVCTAVLIMFLFISGFAYLYVKSDIASTDSCSVIIGLITWGSAFVGVRIIFGDFLGDIDQFKKIIDKTEGRWMKRLMKFSIVLCIFGITYVIWLAMFSIIITYI